MENQNYQNDPRYGKRPLWQWVIVYLVIAAVLYGLVYYFFMAKKSGYNYGPSQGMEQQSTPQNPVTTPTAVPSQTPAAAVETSVMIKNFAFSPATLTVKKGTKVTWTNNDGVPHTVTGDNGGPVSAPISSGASYSYVFNEKGTFSYHCSIHRSMTATVKVTD